MTDSFEARVAARSAAVYADFVLPHLAPDCRLLDVGTGPGTIALGLAGAVPRGRVFGIDRDGATAGEVRAHAAANGVSSLAFLGGDAVRLPFRDDGFDVVFSHSMLETFADPVLPLREMRRVLRPGGLVAVASVEYSGVMCSGPDRERLDLFYATKEKVWRLDRLAEPRMGRELGRHLVAAGFTDVEASARTIDHGGRDAVRAFGRARADDCEAEWFADSALRHGLLTRTQLTGLRDAWLAWSETPGAFAAFSWCRALGRKPTT